MILLLLFYLLLSCKLISIIYEFLEAKNHYSLIPKLFYSLVSSDLFYLFFLLVACYLVNPMKKRVPRMVLILLTGSVVWDGTNSILLIILIYSHKITILNELLYKNLFGFVINTLSLLCGYARGRIGSKSGATYKTSDLENGSTNTDDLELYYDKNKSSVELHIHSDSESTEDLSANAIATSISNYTARRPDEVPLKQFEKVQLISQHKSYAIVRKKNGLEGRVPASLLNTS